MYLTSNLKTYLDDLAGRKSTPGGGSAAAATGALGLAALFMVGNFTVDKEKYKAVQEEISRVLSESERLRQTVQDLIDEDVTVYSSVTTAYRMPKATDEEKSARQAAIKAALSDAMQVPLRLCRTLREAGELCTPLLERGNRNLVSDVAVGVELIVAAYASGMLNVDINLSALGDEALTKSLREELETGYDTLCGIRNKIVEQTKEIVR